MKLKMTVLFVALAIAGVIAFTSSSRAMANQAATDNLFAVDGVHSSVIFKIRHAGVAPFFGRFNKIDGEFLLDRESPANSRMTFSVDLSSVDTGNKDRDAHIRNPDFFSVKQFPEASFKATSVRSLGGDMYELRGPLALHGVEKEVIVMLEYFGEGTMRGQEVAGFEATFEFKRSDFGITTYLAEDGGEGGPLGNTITVIIGIEGKR